jgi:hypothetical protein
MAKDGKTLEALVHAIESAISGAPNVRVEAKKRLPDKDTGQLREHDVVLTYTLAHHKFLLALECRDRSRPIGVPDVEAFHAKCLRTGIGRGVMVSSRGFRKTALKKAESYEIGCFKLEEVARFDWGLTPAALVVQSYSVLGGNLQVEIEGGLPAYGPLYCQDGSPVDWPTTLSWAIRFFNHSVQHEHVEGNVTRTFVDNAPTLYILAPDGNKVAVTRVTNTVRYDIKRTLVPMEFRNYIDAAQGKLLTSAATAQLNIQELPVTVVVNKLEDGSLKATFVPTTDERYKGWSLQIESIKRKE